MILHHWSVSCIYILDETAFLIGKYGNLIEINLNMVIMSIRQDDEFAMNKIHDIKKMIEINDERILSVSSNGWVYC